MGGGGRYRRGGRVTFMLHIAESSMEGEWWEWSIVDAGRCYGGGDRGLVGV